MRSKKYGLEIYGQPNRNAWVSRDASGGNDGAHVTGAEIENGNRLKLTLSDGQLIVASGTISTGHFSDSTSQVGSIFFDNGNVGLGSDADFAAKLHISGKVLSTGSANFGGTNFTDGVIIDSESIKIIPRSTVTHSASDAEYQAIASSVGSIYGYAWVFINNGQVGVITRAHYDAVTENETIITDFNGVEWLVRYKYTYGEGNSIYYVFFTENVGAPNVQIANNRATWPGGPAADSETRAWSYQAIGYYDFTKDQMTQEAFDAATTTDLPAHGNGEILSGSFGTHMLLQKQDLGDYFRFWIKRQNGSYLAANDLPANISWGEATGDVTNEIAANPAKIELYCESSGLHKVTLQAPSHSDFSGSGDVVFTLPSSTGSANQVLVTDGSGATSWVDGSTITGTSQSSESSNDPTFLIDFSYDIRPNTGNNTKEILSLYDFSNSSVVYETNVNIANLSENNAGFNRDTSTSFETSPSDAQSHFISGIIPCDSTVTKVQMSFATPSMHWGYPTGITMLIFKGSYISGNNSNIQWSLISRLSTGPVQGNSIVFFEESPSSSNTFSKGDFWCAAFYSDDDPNDHTAEFINFRGNLYFSDSAYEGGTSQGGGQSGGPGDRGQSTDDPEIVYDSALFEITEVTVNELSRIEGEQTKIKFLVKGMNRFNYDSFIDFSNPRVTIPSQGGWWANPEEITTEFDFRPNNYTLITHSWAVKAAGVHTGTQLKLTIRYSDTSDIHLAPLSIFTYVSSIAPDDPFTIAADDQPGLGYIDLLPAVESGDRTGVVISPPYFNTEDGIMSFSDNHTWGPNLAQPDIEVNNNGLRWEIKAYEAVSLSDRTNGAPINYMPRLITGGGQQGFGAFVARWTQNGQGYYFTDFGDPLNNDPELFIRMDLDPQIQDQSISDHHNSWISPVDGGTPQINAEITSTDDGYGIFAFGFWEHTYNHDTSVPFPDENTTFDLYMSKKSTGLLGISGEGSDIKIQIDIGDYISGKPAAENMTVKYFRNQNTSDVEAPVWTQYDKLYLCGKQPGEVSSGTNSDDSSDDGLNPFSGSASGVRIIDVSENLSFEDGGASSVTLSIDGLDVSNYNKFVDFESITTMITNFGHDYSAEEISVQFSADYKLLVFSWTNVGVPVRADDSHMRFFYGASNYPDACNFHFQIVYNTTDPSIRPILSTDPTVNLRGIGELLQDVRSGNRNGLLISPPYLKNSDVASNYIKEYGWSSVKKNNSTTYVHSGPRWTFPIYDVTPLGELQKYSNHRFEGMDSNGINADMAATWTREGARYKIGMTDRFLWDLEGNEETDTQANRVGAILAAGSDTEIGAISMGFWGYNRSASRTAQPPDENTIVCLYIKRESFTFKTVLDQMSTDIKIEIDMGPFIGVNAVASNMTIKFYRNHNHSTTGIPYWIEYDNIYLSGQPLKSVAAGAPTILEVNGFGQDRRLQVMFEDVSTNNSTSIEYTVDGTNWTPFPSMVSPQIIEGLENEVSYSVKLRAINALGTATESNVISATPTLRMTNAPSFTMSGTFDGFGIDAFEVPEVAASKVIDGYKVQVIRISNGELVTDAVRAINITQGGFSFAVDSYDGLEWGEEYSVRISTRVNSSEQSEYSDPVIISPGIAPTDAPDIKGLFINGDKFTIQVDDMNGSTQERNMRNSMSGPDHLKKFEYSINGGPWIDGGFNQFINNVPTEGGIDHTVKNSVKLRKVNIIGYGPESSEAFLPVPVLPVAVEVGTDRIKWSFTPLAAQYGVTNYQYKHARLNNSGDWVNFPGGIYEVEKSGLLDNRDYEMSIIATNSYGSGKIGKAIIRTGPEIGDLRFIEDFSSLSTRSVPEGIRVGLRYNNISEALLILDKDASPKFVIELKEEGTAIWNEIVVDASDLPSTTLGALVIISPDDYDFINFGTRYNIRAKLRASFDNGVTVNDGPYEELDDLVMSGVSPEFIGTVNSIVYRQEYEVTGATDGFSATFGIDGGSIDTLLSSTTLDISSRLGLKYSIDNGVVRLFESITHVGDHAFIGVISGNEPDFISGQSYAVTIHYDTGAFDGSQQYSSHTHSVLPMKPIVSHDQSSNQNPIYPRINIEHDPGDPINFSNTMSVINSAFPLSDVSEIPIHIDFQFEINNSGEWRFFSEQPTGGGDAALADNSEEYLSDASSKYLHIREAWDDITSSWSSLDTYPQGEEFGVKIRTVFRPRSIGTPSEKYYSEPSDTIILTRGQGGQLGTPSITSMTWNAGVATMNWTAPNNTTGSLLDNYQYSINGGGFWSSITDSSALISFTFSQTIGEEITYLLRAVTQNGIISRASSFTLLAGNAPGEPTINSFVYSHAKGAGVLTWDPPQDTGGVPLVDYEAKSSIDGPWIRMVGSANLTSHDFVGMPIGQEQFRYIRAKNAAGKVSSEVLSPTITPALPSISDFYISYQSDFVADPDVPIGQTLDYRVTRIDLVWEGVESVNENTPVALYETNASGVLDTSVELVAVKISPRYSDPDANGVTNNVFGGSSVETYITQMLGRRSIEFKYRKNTTLRDLLDKIEERLQRWGRKDIPAAPNTFYIRYYHRDSDGNEVSTKQVTSQQIPDHLLVSEWDNMGLRRRISFNRDSPSHPRERVRSEDNRDIPITPQDFEDNGIYPITMYSERKENN